MILSSLTAPTSSSVGPSVPVSPIFVLRSVVVVRLRTSATLPPGFCCVQMRSCALSFKCGCAVKEKFPIFSAGSAGLRAGGGAEESPVVFQRRHRQHTHREKKQTELTGGGGRCFQCSDGFGRERFSSLPLFGFSLERSGADAPSHGLVWVPAEMLLVWRCSWKWVWVLGALSATPPSAQQRPSVSLA